MPDVSKQSVEELMKLFQKANHPITYLEAEQAAHAAVELYSKILDLDHIEYPF